MKNDISVKEKGVSVIECSQPKGVEPKLGGRKLRSAVYW